VRRLVKVLSSRGERVDRYSTAMLEIFRLLGGRWSLLYPLIPIPKLLRDMIYDLVASQRHRWFGRLDPCRLPTPEERTRFLERV
jgi:predicted DCC family thiol-disulfide oxidoreductase YuxK